MECALRMILITSASYVNKDFQIEIGKLPPSFLPLGNKRLYMFQINFLKKHFPKREIFISLPNNYKLNLRDQMYLKKFEINLIFIKENLSLGSSVNECIINMSKKIQSRKLIILHGDTLIKKIPKGDDLVAVSNTSIDYVWEIQNKVNNLNNVWCGFFSFSDKKLLSKSLKVSKYDFVEGVKKYSNYKKIVFKQISSWFDLGHLQTYFLTRSNFLISRKFNEMKINNGYVEKTSNNLKKIKAEIFWYNNFPLNLKKYIPNMIYHQSSKENSFYRLEFLPVMPLNEIYVNCSKTSIFWKKIFTLCKKVLSEFRHEIIISKDEKKKIKSNFEKLIFYDLNKRVKSFRKKSKLNFDLPVSINNFDLPSLNTIIFKCQNIIKKSKNNPSIIHGDFCLSNIFYDNRSENIKLIDPRGIDASNNFTLFGDQKYDISKFTHSIIGFYDHILSESYFLEYNDQMKFKFDIMIDENTLLISKLYKKIFFNNKDYKYKQILALTILLFFRILDLHSDDKKRQIAFIANALRLYKVLISTK